MQNNVKNVNHFVVFSVFFCRWVRCAKIFQLTFLSSFTLFFCCLVDITASQPVIQQSPASILIKAGQVAHLHCYHGDTNYPYMLWYQSAAGGRKTLDLIGLFHYENQNLEKGFENRINMTGHSKAKAQLIISDTKPEDTAEYFCAAS